MSDWYVEEDCRHNVVDEDGKDVAFFQREEDADRCVEAVNSVERLREAITPSAETKAAYMGEFYFIEETAAEDAEGEPYTYLRKVFVPWTTIKEIMKAIRTRAALPIPVAQEVKGRIENV